MITFRLPYTLMNWESVCVFSHVKLELNFLAEYHGRVVRKQNNFVEVYFMFWKTSSHDLRKFFINIKEYMVKSATML